MRNECSLCHQPGQLLFSQRDLLLGIRPSDLHDVFYCSACDFSFLNPITEEVLAEYYPEQYYASKRRRLLNKLRTYLRSRSVAQNLAPGVYLDVGCGRGELLQEMKRQGWQALGIDWNQENADRLSEQLQLPVYGGTKAWDNIPAESVDVVSLLHVLEHDSDPMSLLDKVHRVLKPGGGLVVGVPNGNSLTKKVFNNLWMGYDIPRHRCVFSPRSLRFCLEKGGFRIDRLTGRFSDELLDLTGSCRFLYRDRKSAIAAVFIATAFLRVLISSVLVPGPGSVMYAYAKRH